MRWRRVVISALTGYATAAVSGLVLYERIMVPLLPTVTAVPLWWWGLAASPLWLGALYLGSRAASIRELAGVSLAAAFGSHAYLYWASVTNRPGLVNQPLAETGPFVFWTEALFGYWLLLALPFASGYAGRLLLKRPRDGPSIRGSREASLDRLWLRRRSAEARVSLA